MVDWDQVDRLREKGWDWKRIAQDPKVGFHADPGVSDEGRALRALYYRRRSREERKPSPKGSKRAAEEEAQKTTWTLARIGYLTTPLLAIWFVVAYFVPSPVGLILPAIPWLALGLAVVAFILAFGLWRAKGARWSKLYRHTVTYGIVTGLVLVGVVAATAYLVFGCPFLPSASSLATQSASGQPNGDGPLNIPASDFRDDASLARQRQAGPLLLWSQLVSLLFGGQLGDLQSAHRIRFVERSIHLLLEFQRRGCGNP